MTDNSLELRDMCADSKRCDKVASLKSGRRRSTRVADGLNVIAFVGILIVLFGLMTLTSTVLYFLLGDVVLNIAMQERALIGPRNSGWEERNFSRFFYVWNTTNVPEILAGKLPKMQLIGPFSMQLHERASNVTVTNQSIVSYKYSYANVVSESIEIDLHSTSLFIYNPKFSVDVLEIETPFVNLCARDVLQMSAVSNDTFVSNVIFDADSGENNRSNLGSLFFVNSSKTFDYPVSNPEMECRVRGSMLLQFSPRTIDLDRLLWDYQLFVPVGFAPLEEFVQNDLKLARYEFEKHAQRCEIPQSAFTCNETASPVETQENEPSFPRFEPLNQTCSADQQFGFDQSGNLFLAGFYNISSPDASTRQYYSFPNLASVEKKYREKVLNLQEEHFPSWALDVHSDTGFVIGYNRSLQMNFLHNKYSSSFPQLQSDIVFPVAIFVDQFQADKMIIDEARRYDRLKLKYRWGFYSITPAAELMLLMGAFIVRVSVAFRVLMRKLCNTKKTA